MVFGIIIQKFAIGLENSNIPSHGKFSHARIMFTSQYNILLVVKITTIEWFVEAKWFNLTVFLEIFNMIIELR